jgi:hypothetical protein
VDIHEFVEFCKWVNIFDTNITMTTIKECFVRANEDPEATDSQNENPADELVRFEFVDILLMLAEIKLK